MRKKMKGYIIQIVFLLILLAVGYWQHNHRVYQAKRQAFVMDTLLEIEIKGKSKNLEAVLDSCFALAEGYEEMLSVYIDTSEVSRINQSAGNPVAFSPDIACLLHTAEIFYNKTEGRYDISLGRLSDIWDFSKAELPSPELVETALQSTGFDKLRLQKDVLLLPPQMKLNFGSIAKGYIVDRIKDYLNTCNLDEFLLNAGGDIYVKSEKPLLIGIQHPRKKRGSTIDNLLVKNCAVVTSGDYERYFELDGKRYHHIIDAVSGYPAQNCLAVTALAAETLTADALSTAAFLMKPEEAVRIADDIEGAAVLVYYLKNGEVKRIASSKAAQYLKEE